MNRSVDWLRQAQHDLKYLDDLLQHGAYHLVCFLAQQSAEKALKALAFHRGIELVKSHSVREIAKDLGLNGEIEEYSKVLDRYYISARYPDAFPSGAPYEFFTRRDAEDANRFTAHIIRRVEDEMR